MAEKVVEVAKDIAGVASAEEAVAAIEAEPALKARFQQQVSANSDQWLGMVTRLAELEEKSRGDARAFAQAYGRAPVVGRFTFVEFLSLLVVVGSGLGAVAMVIWGNLTAEMKSAIVTMILIGGFTAVTGFWLGSSYGSMMKNAPPAPQRNDQA